jgi:soluble lytic murein transglycosylase-like protein
MLIKKPALWWGIFVLNLHSQIIMAAPSIDNARCFEQSGHKYAVSPYLLIAIAKTESSLNSHAINTNNDGSRDIGIMQINTFWFEILRQYAIEPEDLFHTCLNIDVGAWVLAQAIQQYGYTWTAVGAYNTGKPTNRNLQAHQQYIQRVQERLCTGAGDGFDGLCSGSTQ